MGVARLLSVTETLKAPRIFERSVKLTSGAISTDRGLVSMDKRALYPGPKTTLRETCTALGCSDTTALEPYLSAATAIHFGADEDIGKCYLEFASHNAPEADLVFLALKWKGQTRRINRYSAFTKRPHSEKHDLVRKLVPEPAIATVMLACLDLAREGDPDGEAVVLHVTEEGTNRSSVDVSVADARASLADVAQLLSPLWADKASGLRDILDGNQAARFGHIAAGTDRKGATFVTIYYGAAPLC